MARFQDPGLFPSDHLLDRYLLDVHIFGRAIPVYPRGLGYGILFFGASFFVDHVLLSKYLVFLLMPVSIFYLYKLGRSFRGKREGLMISFFFIFLMLGAYQSISIASGLQRSFAIPLLIIFVYYLLEEKYVGVGFLILLSALFYLPVFPVIAGTSFLSLIDYQPPFRFSFRIEWRKYLPVIVGLGLSVLFIIWIFSIDNSAKFIGLEQKEGLTPFSDNPRYQAGGIAPLYLIFPLVGRAGFVETGTEVIFLLIFMLLGLVLFLVSGQKVWDFDSPVFRNLLVASLVCYFLSLFVILKFSSTALYFPSRYTKYVLFFGSICGLGLHWEGFLSAFPDWIYKNFLWIILVSLGIIVGLITSYFLLPSGVFIAVKWLITIIGSGLFLVLGPSCLLSWFRRGSWQERSNRYLFLVALLITVVLSFLSAEYFFDSLGQVYIDPPDFERRLYDYLEDLPKDVLIAGDPLLMNRIPLFAKRDVLYREIQPPPHQLDLIMEYFHVQYSGDSRPVFDFCRKHDVNYLVVDNRDFNAESLATGEVFYPSFNQALLDIIKVRDSYALQEMEPVFESGPIFVINCEVD
jgi:hypothetical protein